MSPEIKVDHSRSAPEIFTDIADDFFPLSEWDKLCSLGAITDIIHAQSSITGGISLQLKSTLGFG